MKKEIYKYVQAALSQGMDMATIRSNLGKSNWPAPFIDRACSGYQEDGTRPPIPVFQRSTTALEWISYLLLCWVIGMLLFSSLYVKEYFLYKFFDPSFTRTIQSIRFSLSCLIVGTPVFIWALYKFNQAIKSRPYLRKTRAREIFLGFWMLIFSITSLLISNNLVYNLLGLSYSTIEVADDLSTLLILTTGLYFANKSHKLL